MKKLLLIVGLSLLTCSGFGQSRASADHVRTLLELTGSAKLGMQIMENMITNFKTSMPNVPDEFWDEFLKENSQTQLFDMIVPIYEKHFSDAEIVRLIAFYRTPLGMKLTEKLPLISQDAYKAGSEWGKQIGERAVKKLSDNHYMD